MSLPTLKTVTRTQGNNAAVKEGAIVPDGFRLEFEEVPVLVQAFRRMVRMLEFDVCEMALTTYLCAREHGVAFTALPIFLVRDFHHKAILHDARRPISDLRTLEGRRVGVGRGYTVTTGVWARGILEEEHGVRLDRVTWVRSGDEHVEAYRAPANVEQLATGKSIEAELLAGELAAAINVPVENPAIEPAIAAPLEAGLAAFRSRGHYPINHCIVVRNDVLDAHPTLAAALFQAFSESKTRYVRALAQRPLESLGGADQVYKRIQLLGAEPLPYGIEPNRAVLETLIAHALAQRILTRRPQIESVFAAATHGLVG